MLVLQRRSGRRVFCNDSSPCGDNGKEQLCLPAGRDWLDKARPWGAVHLSSRVFNLAKMNQTYSRGLGCLNGFELPDSILASPALPMTLSSHSDLFCLQFLFGKLLFNKANTWRLLTLFIQISPLKFNTRCEHLQNPPPPEYFLLLSEMRQSPGPIICFDCQGSTLAQGSVAMLQWKTGRLLSCGPEGCWDGEPKPCGGISLWRRTMFKNEPLWAVYSMLKQHCSHLAGGKTNKAYKLKLKTHYYCCSAVLLRSCCWVASYTKQTTDLFCIKGVCSLTGQNRPWSGSFLLRMRPCIGNRCCLSFYGNQGSCFVVSQMKLPFAVNNNIL